jgi:HAD superfamily phosphatase (TIGR01668 family)
MALYKLCIPDQFHFNIKDIDYIQLEKQGIKTLFFDLDNTVISYDEAIIQGEHAELLRSLQKTFKIVIVSNSGFKRVSTACKKEKFKFVHSAKKPLKSGFNKALLMSESDVQTSVFIGDQLMTDILGANRIGMISILIYPVKKRSDHLFTRMNRRIEKHIIHQIKIQEPEAYDLVIKPYVEHK